MLLQEWDVFPFDRFRTGTASIDQADQELAARIQTMFVSPSAALVNAKSSLCEIGLYEMLKGQLSKVRLKSKPRSERLHTASRWHSSFRDWLMRRMAVLWVKHLDMPGE